MTAIPLREMRLLWHECDVLAETNKPRLIEILVNGTTGGKDWQFGMELQYQGPEMVDRRPMRIDGENDERMEVPAEACDLTIIHYRRWRACSIASNA